MPPPLPLPPPPPPPPPQAPPPMQQPAGLPPGVVKPAQGVCSQCNANQLEFFDNGIGQCFNCGRTFDWVAPQLQRMSDIQSPEPEDNPFIVSEEEKLSLSERKAEVEPEDIFHEPLDSASKRKKDKDKDREKKSDTKDEEKLSDEDRLNMLEDRFINGQISEETYKKLRGKFTTKILKNLEDRLVKGNITENEYNDLKEEYE
jgi:uncharacterized membrane protein